MPERQRSMMSSLPAVLTAIGGVVLLVLALLRWRDNGWGATVWLAMFILMCVIRTPYAIRSRANVIVEARKDTKEKVLLFAMFLTMMVLPLVHLATGVFAFAGYGMPGWATWTGAVLQLPFLLLFWRSHADLGLNWSPGLEVRKDHRLVTQGVYAGIRHPMYTAIWLAVLTQPLLIHNWLAGVSAIPAFAAMWFLRVPQEEALMRARFGDAYDAYAARAGRLLPKIGG